MQKSAGSPDPPYRRSKTLEMTEIRPSRGATAHVRTLLTVRVDVGYRSWHFCNRLIGIRRRASHSIRETAGRPSPPTGGSAARSANRTQPKNACCVQLFRCRCRSEGCGGMRGREGCAGPAPWNPSRARWTSIVWETSLRGGRPGTMRTRLDCQRRSRWPAPLAVSQRR